MRRPRWSSSTSRHRPWIPIAAEQLLEFLGRAVPNGRSCILITHKLNEVLNHTQRVVVMKDARVVADVPAAACRGTGSSS